MKELLRGINLDAPGVKERMFTAIQGGLEEWEKGMSPESDSSLL